MNLTDVSIPETLETAYYLGFYIFFCLFRVHVQYLKKLVTYNYLYIDSVHCNQIDKYNTTQHDAIFLIIMVKLRVYISI